MFSAPEKRLCAVHHQRPARAGQSGRAERQADAWQGKRCEHGPMRGAVPAQLVQEVAQVVRAADRHQTPCERQVDLQRRGRLVRGGSSQPGCCAGHVRGAAPAQLMEEKAQVVRAADCHQAPHNREVLLVGPAAERTHQQVPRRHIRCVSYMNQDRLPLSHL